MGFCLACIGSAVGIGNIWRFPYITGENGGGAFLVPYVIITVCFGAMFMILEFAVGRYYKNSVIECFAKIRTKFKWFGIVTVTVTFVILSYYLVILGWILSFFVLMVMGDGFDFESYVSSWYPVVSFVIVLVITFLIVQRGISAGIEKLNKIGISLLIALLLPLTAYALTLDGASQGLEYYLTPDFDVLQESSIWSTAFGQVFFSLSLGGGILLTYGSYLTGKNSLVKSTAIIVTSNAMVSFIAGLMIFSIVFTFGMNPEGGIALVFKVMPSIFGSMEFGLIVGSAFFLLLLVAGITSAVSMFQVPVSALEDSTNFSKRKASGIVIAAVFGLGIITSLSYSAANLELFGQPILDVLDTYFGSYGLSISAVIFVIIVTWFIEKKKLIEQINLYSNVRIPIQILQIVRFVLPIMVIASIFSTILHI